MNTDGNLHALNNYLHDQDKAERKAARIDAIEEELYLTSVDLGLPEDVALQLAKAYAPDVYDQEIEFWETYRAGDEPGVV